MFDRFLALRSRQLWGGFLLFTTLLGLYYQRDLNHQSHELLAGPMAADTPLMDYLGYTQERVTLSNGLEAWLISAPNSQRACLGVAVNVGAGNDPIEHMGLAHFVEHMVFMGSAQFPQENGFDQFITTHSGAMNAFTSLDHTVYGVQIASEAWPEAVNRMADMLSQPLFNEHSHQRERQAIEEELNNKLNQEGYRSWLILLSLTPEGHPLHKMHCGNTQTLAHTGEKELRALLEQNYYAGSMKLFAVSSQPIEEMRQLVETHFGRLNKEPKEADAATLAFRKVQDPAYQPLFSSEVLGKRIWQTTLSDLSLTLAWELPNQKEPNPRFNLLQEMLAHPYPGGLLDQLRSRELVETISFETSTLNSQSIALLSLQLTPKGLLELEHLLDLTHNYISFVASNPWPDHLLPEQQNSVLTHWELHVEETSLSHALSRADSLLDEPLTTYPDKLLWPTPRSLEQAQQLAGLMDRFSCITLVAAPEALQPTSLKRLSQQGLLEEASQQNHEMHSEDITLREDPWAHTRYVIETASSEPVVALLADLPQWQLPPASPLLPMTLPEFSTSTLAADETEYFNTSFGSLRLCHNVTQGSSCDSLTWKIRSNLAHKASCEQTCHWMILTKLLQDNLLALRTQSAQAGQNLRLSSFGFGLEVSLSGYSGQNQDKILEELADLLCAISVDPQAFEMARDYHIQNLRVDLDEGPLPLLRSKLGAACLKENFEPEQLLNCLLTLDEKCFSHWLTEQLKSSWRFDLIIVSNKSSNLWKTRFEKIHQQLSKESGSLEQLAEREIPLEKHWRDPLQKEWLIEHRRDNGTLVTYAWPMLDSGDQNLKPYWGRQLDNFLALSILEPEFASKAFNELRTKRQLGYVVSARLQLIGHRPVLLLYVLSAAYDRATIEKAIGEYCEEFLASLTTLSDDSFEKQRSRLIFELQEPFTSSQEQLASAQYWSWELGLDPIEKLHWKERAKELTKAEAIASLQLLLHSEPIKFILSTQKEERRTQESDKEATQDANEPLALPVAPAA